MTLTFVANHVRRQRRSFSVDEKITIINSVLRKASNGMTVEAAVKSEGIHANIYYRWRNTYAKKPKLPACTGPTRLYNEIDSIKAFLKSAPSGSILLLKK